MSNIRTFADLVNIREQIATKDNDVIPVKVVKEKSAPLQKQVKSPTQPQIVPPAQFIASPLKQQPTQSTTPPQRPTFTPVRRISESVQELYSIITSVFAALDYEFIDPVISYGMDALTANVCSRVEGLTVSRAVIQTLDAISSTCVSNSHSGTIGTRTLNLLDLLRDVPGVKGVFGTFLRVKVNKRTGEVLYEEVPHARDASNAYEILLSYDGLVTGETEAKMRSLDSAKCTPLGSLRVDELKTIRVSVPDAGILAFLAAIEMNGYHDNGNPIIDISRLNISTLHWIVSTLRNARSVVYTENIFDRAVQYRTYVGLDATVDEIRSLQKRMKNKLVSVEDQTDVDKMILALDSTMAEIDAKCVTAIDELLAYVRFKQSEKEWHRVNSAQRKGEVAKPLQMPSKKLAPMPRASLTRAGGSKATPDEAVALLKQEGVDIDIEIRTPSFNNDVLNVTEVSRKKLLKSVGLDGVRECAVYPGVIWEAVMGPLDHAMDIDREENELRIVIIAPRRKDGMGLDLAQSRALMVNEYESYFSPVTLM